MDVAAQAILRQADEIMIKRTDPTEMIESIKRRIASGTSYSRPKTGSVATILGRAVVMKRKPLGSFTNPIGQDWIL